MNISRVTGSDPLPTAGSAHKPSKAPKRVERMDRVNGIRQGDRRPEDEDEEEIETEGVLDERTVLWDAMESNASESEYWRESFPLEDHEWGTLLGSRLKGRVCAQKPFFESWN